MNELHDYTIDEKYIFEQKTSLIYLKLDHNQNIELSKPAARLFSEIILLNLKKGIATRDELLTNVWEEHGLVGSNNNLNTYISEIRKKFELIGIDPHLIVTVPKKGFRLDTPVVFFKEENINQDNQYDEETPYHHNKLDYVESFTQKTKTSEFINEPNTLVTELPLTITNENHEENIPIIEPITIAKKTLKKERKNVGNKKIKLVLLAISTLAACYLVYLLAYDVSPKKRDINNYLTVSTRENCVIQTPIDMIGKTSDENIEFINTKLEKYNISCAEPKRVILLSDLNKTYSFDKNVAISICKEMNNKYDCVSINDQRI
ncbi:winged helix-turn-helix domain-containing protein [Providencia sp.]|uniref:winged helix-turn-helix domain-containing protein n=1 Tax=Providencia sp. TaxID=589 RepID=UPI0033414EF2